MTSSAAERAGPNTREGSHASLGNAALIDRPAGVALAPHQTQRRTGTGAGDRARPAGASKPVATATSVALSVVLHAGLLLLAGTLVLRAAVRPLVPSGGFTMSFDEPDMLGGGSGIVGGPDSPPRSPSGFPSNPRSLSSVQVTIDTPERNLAPLVGMGNSPLLLALSTAYGQSQAAAARSSDPRRFGGALTGSSAAFALGGGLDEGVASAKLRQGGARGVSFAGLGASTARSVVYAVDASGPMVTSLPMVLDELERSVSRLGPTQMFGVVLFRQGGAGSGPQVESFAPVLLRATPTARARLREWLAGIQPGGRSSPLAGLEAALSFQPEAVFLLSRSIERSGGGVWDLGLAPTLSRIDELNPRLPDGTRRVTIQTIQFLDDDPTGIMQAIGERHGQTSAASASPRGYRVVRSTTDLATP
jgi:hypothetical protein